MNDLIYELTNNLDTLGRVVRNVALAYLMYQGARAVGAYADLYDLLSVNL